MGAAPRKTRTKLLTFLLLIVIVGVAGMIFYLRRSTDTDQVPNTVAEGFQHDRINVVLIGIGGEGHTGRGALLADAIMVASLKPSTKQVALISIPRDYYVHMGKRMHRITSAHALGSDYPGGGPALMMASVEKVLGQPMHAYVRVDFAAFEKIIDALGGVDIYVYRPFHDFLFNDGFQQGWQHMSGKRALNYARYRYIKSEEGNNYARELRQQQVVAAIRDKVQKLGPQDILKLVAMARTVSNHTSTNLSTGQMVQLYSRFREVDREQIRHVSLAPFTKAIKTNDPADPTPAVGPRAGDNREIRLMARNVFRDKTPIVTKHQIQFTKVDPPSQPAAQAN